MKLKSAPGKFDAIAANFFTRFSRWSARRPVRAIALVSFIAVAINCYPIIFLGKSYVAPAYGVPMLYEGYPTLPGMSAAEPFVTHGSDMGGTLLWGVPLGYLESRSLLDHGELPLWNRFSLAGNTLLGQPDCMLGDPLQYVVIAGRGSALAQDLKFLLAKFLFCAGFGLLIRRILGSLPLALIFSALAAYCGAYYYFYNHPSYFVFAYAPWILLSAIEFLDLQSPRYFRWGLLWLLANFACFNAGFVELAVMLIGGLNVAALAFSLGTNRAAFAAIKVTSRLTIGTALFLAFTAPVWISFLVSLPGAFTIHPEIHVAQLPIASLLGIFDDVFFRLPATPGLISAPAPGTSFLILVGSVYALMSWRTLKRDVFFWVNTSAIALWGGIVFGWIPAALIALVPMLNREGHTYKEFSFLLVIHLTIQCAYGFRCLAREETFRRAGTKLLWTVFVMAALTLLFCYGFPHGDIPWIYYFPIAAGAIGAPLLFAYLKNRPSLSLWAAIGVLVLAFVPNFRFGLYNFGNKSVLLVPGERVRLDAPSSAINWIKADHSSPFRITGAEVILPADYAAVYDLETITSCEPLSNGELVNLIRGTPGFFSHTDWETDLTNVVAAHALLNLLNVKYVLTPPLIQLQDGLGFRVPHKSDLGVLENLDVWPRAFFANKIVPLASTKEFIDYLLTHGNQPFAALTPDEIASAPALLSLPANSNSTVAAATHYTLLPNSTAFDIHAASAGIVCLTEGQARDFSAIANGEAKTVLTVNRAFKGIYLDKPGDYHIQFTYRPRHWRLACALFASAIAITAVLAMLHFIFGKFKKVELLPNPDIPVP
jgi:hypothetical protein